MGVAGINTGSGVDPMLGNYHRTGGGWLPTDDASAHLWLDAQRCDTVTGAASGAADGGTVTAWANRLSGAPAAQMQQSGVIPLPTFVKSGINGFPSIYFDGTQVMVADSPNGLTSMAGCTIMAVYTIVTPRPSGSTTITCTLNASFASRQRLENEASPTYVAMAGGRRLDTDGYAHVDDGPVAPNVPYIQVVSYDYSNALANVTLAGTTGSGAFQTAGTSAAAEAGSLSVGGLVGGTGIGYQMTGYLGEVIWIKRFMDAQALVGPLAYLRNKWRIPL
jgi:hypothetical protein